MLTSRTTGRVPREKVAEPHKKQALCRYDGVHYGRDCAPPHADLTPRVLSLVSPGGRGGPTNLTGSASRKRW